MGASPTASTQYAASADGTSIAYEVTGNGFTLVIVEGALCHRGMGAFEELAPILAGRFTVVGCDRRGRGETGLERRHTRSSGRWRIWSPSSPGSARRRSCSACPRVRFCPWRRPGRGC